LQLVPWVEPSLAALKLLPCCCSFFFNNFFLQNICLQVVSGSPENLRYLRETMQYSLPLIRGHFLSFFVYENCFFSLLLVVRFLRGGVEIFQLHHPPTHSPIHGCNQLPAASSMTTAARTSGY
jgi:hypothetical protein